MAAKWAMGTKLQRKNPVSLAYEDIIGLGDITGPSENVDWLDTTSHSSPNESEEGVPTVHRHGEISAPMHFDPALTVHRALLTDKNTKRLGDWRVVMTDPASTRLDFQGYVVALDYVFPVLGAMDQMFKLRVTGALTMT